MEKIWKIIFYKNVAYQNYIQKLDRWILQKKLKKTAKGLDKEILMGNSFKIIILTVLLPY